MDVDRVHVLDRCIGSGAFGTVHLGVHEDTGQQVAVKRIVFPSEGQRGVKLLENATSEIVLMKQLDHPNIVQYLGAKRDGYSLYIYMEYVSGGTLGSLIRSMRKLSYVLANKVLKDILHGLDYLHHRSICHRDVKCDNVLLLADGTAKLGDFGTSKYIQACYSLCSGLKSICGTPWYMAPEVINGEAYGLPVDIWGIGGVLYESVVGKHPYHEFQNIHAAMFHIAAKQQPPTFPDDLPQGAVDFMLCCFQQDPRARMRADELLQHPYVTGDESGTMRRRAAGGAEGSSSSSTVSSSNPTLPEEAEVEDFSPEDAGQPAAGLSALQRCEVCREAVAVFLCRECVRPEGGALCCCAACWGEAHGRGSVQHHVKQALLFHPQWAEPASPAVWQNATADTAASDSVMLSLGGSAAATEDGVVTANGQYVGLLRHEDLQGNLEKHIRATLQEDVAPVQPEGHAAHAGLCSLNNAGVCRLAAPLEARWACMHCTYENHEDLRICEICEKPR